MILRGACHCGDLSLELSTARSPDALVVRACACSHCEQRQALYTADAAGHVRISARDPARVLRYRFALETADFEAIGERLGGLGVPIVAVQEGGYCTEKLGDNAVALLRGLRAGLQGELMVGGRG